MASGFWTSFFRFDRARRAVSRSHLVDHPPDLDDAYPGGQRSAWSQS